MLLQNDKLIQKVKNNIAILSKSFTSKGMVVCLSIYNLKSLVAKETSNFCLSSRNTAEFHYGWSIWTKENIQTSQSLEIQDQPLLSY